MEAPGNGLLGLILLVLFEKPLKMAIVSNIIVVVLILNCLSFHNICGKEFTSSISEGINDNGINFSTQ